MLLKQKIFRVFVSSMFQDMYEERDELVKLDRSIKGV